MKRYFTAITFLVIFFATIIKANAQCPTPSMIIPTASNSYPCVDTFITLTAPNLAGHTYQWFFANSVPIIQGPANGNSIIVSWNSGGQKPISVVATNSCGNSSPYTPFSFWVYVTENNFSFGSILGVNSVCSGSYTYLIDPLSSDFYASKNITWSLSGGGTITPIIDPTYNVATKAIVNWGTSTGSKTLTAIASNICGNTKTQNLTVNVSAGIKPTASDINGIIGTDYFCIPPSGLTKSYSVNNQTGVTYSWGLSQNSNEQIPSAIGTLSSTGNTSSVNWSSVGNSYLHVTPSTSLCSGEKKQIGISIASAPISGNITANKTIVCAGELIALSVTIGSTIPIFEVRKYLSGRSTPINNTPPGWTIWETVPSAQNYSTSYTVPISDNNIGFLGTVLQYEFRARFQTASGTNCIVYSNVATVSRKYSQYMNFNSISSKTYGDAPFNLTISNYSGLPIVFTSSNPSIASISGSIVTINGAGSVIIYANQSGNAAYCDAPQVSQTLSISKASLTVTANNLSKNYGDPNPPLAITYTGLLNGDNSSVIDVPPNISTSATTLSNTGTYPIALSVGTDNNYIISRVNGTLNINKANLIVTANNASKIYGSANPLLSISYSGFKNGEIVTVLDLPPTVSTLATVASNSGTYPITVTGGSDNNYTFTYVNGTLSVNKANLTVTANSASKNYGAANPALSNGYSGFLNGETAAVIDLQPSVSTTATVTGNAGIYPTIPAGGSDNNYSFSYVNGSLTINKATLIVVANNAYKEYLQPNPSFSISYSGFVNSETISVLDYQPTISTTATASSSPGNYPIVPSGGFDNNYIFSFINGTLTINAPPPPSCSVYINTSGDLCANGRVKLSAVASGGSPSSYSWSTGESSSSIWAYDGGDYSVTVYFSNGCSESANTYIEYPSGRCIYYRKAATEPVSLPLNVDIPISIHIYPNPANESFVIELPNKSESPLSVNLIDQLGRPVHELFFEKGEQRKSINTQNLSEGIYIVQIGTGKAGVVRKKVLIVHNN